VSGKAGSGKSFFVAQYVDAYHATYPKNRVFYVSLNRIARDSSYESIKILQARVIEEAPVIIPNITDYSLSDDEGYTPRPVSVPIANRRRVLPE
jgi:KaiC/GvpD/RAD55 family RecA-like ATPase